MRRQIILTALIFLFSSVFLIAGETAGLKIRPDAPEVYEVKKGDTLWDIAEYFFGDPFTWPDIWKKNDFIKDPHWIYPGQKITIKDFLNKMTETTAESPEKPEATDTPEPLFLDKAPRMSIQDNQSIKKETAGSEDPNIIKLLASPKLAYSRESYFRTGWIAKRSQFPVNKISGIEEGLTEATKYDTVIINSGSEDGVKAGDIYAVLGVGDQVKNPETGKDIGFVLCIKGIAEVIEFSAQTARCRITDNFSPIETGDMVSPFKAPVIPKFDAWVKPVTKIGGSIIAVNDPLISIHLNDINLYQQGSC